MKEVYLNFIEEDKNSPRWNQPNLFASYYMGDLK